MVRSGDAPARQPRVERNGKDCTGEDGYVPGRVSPGYDATARDRSRQPGDERRGRDYCRGITPTPPSPPTVSTAPQSTDQYHRPMYQHEPRATRPDRTDE